MNGITSEAKIKAKLSAIIGPSAYKLLRSLVSPAIPHEKSYEELVEETEKHHNPTPSKVQVFKKESKSIAIYLSELHSIALSLYIMCVMLRHSAITSVLLKFGPVYICWSKSNS